MKKEATVNSASVAIKTSAQPAAPAVAKTVNQTEKAVKKDVAEKSAPAVKTETAAKPAEKKAATKKTATKKTTAKKSAAKKTTEKVTNIVIQFNGKEFTRDEIVDKVKKAYESDTGKKASGIKELNIYVKPEDDAAYYVINSKAAGKVDL